jgi:hypothetical protein
MPVPHVPPIDVTSRNGGGVRVTAATGRSGTGSAGVTDGPAEWLANDVPGIVAGLAASGSISAATAVAADRLIRTGRHDRALTLALEEATHVEIR